MRASLKLNQSQLDKLSDIFSDLSLLAVASVILPGLLDRFNIFGVVLGSLAASIFWFYSLWLRR